MLKQFKYTKDNGEASYRVVYPLTVLEANSTDAKLQALDLSDMSDDEKNKAEEVLNDIHREYLDAIYAAGFSSNFRSFFLRGIS